MVQEFTELQLMLVLEDSLKGLTLLGEDEFLDFLLKTQPLEKPSKLTALEYQLI
jgi:hypothetical protein